MISFHDSKSHRNTTTYHFGLMRPEGSKWKLSYVSLSTISLQESHVWFRIRKPIGYTIPTIKTIVNNQA